VRSEKRAAVKRDLDSLAAMDDDEEAVIRIYATPEEAAEYKTATDEFDQTEATYQKLTSLGEPEIVARYGGPNEQKAYTKAVNTDDLDRAVDIAAKAEKRHERDIDRVLDKQEKAGKKLDKVHERLATKTAERHQAKKDELEVKLEDIDVDELEDQDDHSEDFSELSKKNDWALRPLTRAEQRINFAALDDSLDGLIREYQGKLSKEWEMAVEGLRREVAGWVTSEKVSPDAILRKAQRLSMDLDGYVNEMERGALEAYGLGKRTADGELDAAGRSRTFEAKVSPENPHDLGHFRGLIRSRSFVVAEGQAQKVYSSIANSLMNSFENGDSVVQAIAKLDTQFSALASGQLISPGTSGHDYSKPAIQETTVRTLFADSMAGGRNDLFEEETASGFVLGTMRSEVAEGRSERSHPLSEWVDGIKVRMEDPRRLKLTGALHYNERGVDVPITQIDAMEPGFEWSSDAEIEQAIRKKQQLSPNFV
jgi:hypothetical protein